MSRVNSFFCRVGVALILLIVATAPARAQTSACLQADEVSASLRRYVQFLISATDPAHVALRASLRIPVIDTSKVSYVSDAKVCAAVVASINTAMLSPNLVTKAYVLDLGTMYFVQDPTQRAGEWTPAFSVTHKYAYVGLVAL